MSTFLKEMQLMVLKCHLGPLVVIILLLIIIILTCIVTFIQKYSFKKGENCSQLKNESAKTMKKKNTGAIEINRWWDEL